ncbi:MAG: hypothetical protein ABIE55_04555 [Candidatus Aenigmatarchaeota archaeon]
MEETKKMITLEAPPQIWSGSHESSRGTTAGNIKNLGAGQPYKNTVTNEVRSQDYKYANPTQTPFDMYMNIIPGMHPFYWDAASAVITAFSFGLGFADGYIDNRKNEKEFKELNEQLKEVDWDLFKIGLSKTKPGVSPDGGGGIGGPGGAGGNGGIPPINVNVEGSNQHQIMYGGEFNVNNVPGQPSYAVSQSFTFDNDNYTEIPLNVSYGPISTVNKGKSKAKDNWFEKALKHVYAEAGENGEVIISDGPLFYLRGKSSYNSKTTKRKGREKKVKIKPIDSDRSLRIMYDR